MFTPLWENRLHRKDPLLFLRFITWEHQQISIKGLWGARCSTETKMVSLEHKELAASSCGEKTQKGFLANCSS